MGLTTLNTGSISFKKLSGKGHTQQNFALNEESVPSNVQISYTTIFAQKIEPLPVTNSGLTSLYATNGIVERVKFELEIIPDTLIGVGKSQGYRMKLPAGYTGSGVLGSKYPAGTKLYDTLGKLQIVPSLYGTVKGDGSTEYDPKITQTNGSTVITKFDPINYYVDCYNGILFVQDPPTGYDSNAARPGYCEAFLFVGDYLSDVVGVIASGSTGTTASNVGSAVGVYKQKVGENLQFKSFVGGNGISVSGTTNNIKLGYTGATGSGSVTGATNGLTLTGAKKKIGLGGALTGNTTISGSFSESLNFSSLGEFIVYTSGANNGVNLGSGSGSIMQLQQDRAIIKTGRVGIDMQSIYGSGTTMTINGSGDFHGAEYVDDYSTGFTNYSLVHKKYVDTYASGVTGYFIVAGSTVLNDIPLSGFVVPELSGITITTNTKILVNAQSDSTQNGIYLAKVGAWQRIPGFDSSFTINKGAVVFDSYSSINYNIAFDPSTPFVLGTDSIYFNNLGYYFTNAGNGLTSSYGNVNLGGSFTGSNITINGRNTYFLVNIDNSFDPTIGTLGVFAGQSTLGNTYTHPIAPTGTSAGLFISGLRENASARLNANSGDSSTIKYAETSLGVYPDYLWFIRNLSTGTSLNNNSKVHRILKLQNNIGISSTTSGKTGYGQNIEFRLDRVGNNSGTAELQHVVSSVSGVTNNIVNTEFRFLITSGSTRRQVMSLGRYGAVYAKDYSANFGPRSLVDKGYVTGLTFGGGGSIGFSGATNGLTLTGGKKVKLGGVLTGATLVDSTSANTLTFDIQTQGTTFLRGDVGVNTDVNIMSFKNKTTNNVQVGLMDIFLGPNNGSTSAGAGNIGIGQNNLKAVVSAATEFSGGRNIAIGWANQTGMTTGTHNVAIGRKVNNVTSGNYSYSVDIGYETNYKSVTTTNDSHIAIGPSAMGALTALTSTTNMISLGNSSMKSATARDAQSTIAIGPNSLRDADFERYNIVIGDTAGRTSVIGRGNLFMGADAGRAMTGGTVGDFGSGGHTTFNIGIGAHALQSGSGDKNTFIGSESGRLGNTGSYNSGYGTWTLPFASGSYNTALGAYAAYNSGTFKLSGNTNVFIGYMSGYNTRGLTNTIVIGNSLSGTTNNRIYLGNASQPVIFGNISSGTTSNVTVKESTGELRYRSLTDINNQVNGTILIASATGTSSTEFVGFSASTAINYYLPTTPRVFQRVMLSDIRGNALTANVTVRGNGKLINGSSTALINTNYGTAIFVYNGFNWSGGGLS